MAGDASILKRTSSFRGASAFAAGLLLIVLPGALRAQTFDDPGFDDPFLASEVTDAPPVPSIQFSKLHELPLPGPLPESGPRLVDGRIEIAVDGGIVRTAWDESALPETRIAEPETEPPAESVWVEDPSGLTRFRTEPDGRLLAQRRCNRCKSGWWKKWRLRVAGSTVSPPLVTEKRVYFGALDNRVYCVKRLSGHRVWAVNIAGRVNRPLGLVTVSGLPDEEADADEAEATPEKRRKKSGKKSKKKGQRTSPESVDLILVVPDSGSSIRALMAETGQKAAEYVLPETAGTFKGAPVLTPDGMIVVAKQKYEASEASLMVLRLGPGGVPPEVAYNAETPSSGGPEPAPEQTP